MKQEDGAGVTWLHVAALLGDLDSVKRAENLGVSINVSDEKGETPFSLAMKEGHLDVCNYFLDKGVELVPVEVDGDGYDIPFILTVFETCNNEQIIDAILDKMNAKPEDLVTRFDWFEDEGEWRFFSVTKPLMQWAKEASPEAVLCLMAREEPIIRHFPCSDSQWCRTL